MSFYCWTNHCSVINKESRARDPDTARLTKQSLSRKTHRPSLVVAGVGLGYDGVTAKERDGRNGCGDLTGKNDDVEAPVAYFFFLSALVKPTLGTCLRRHR